MNNHNDFGLKKVDLNKRKLKKKNNFFIPLILVISVLTIVLLNNTKIYHLIKILIISLLKIYLLRKPCCGDIVETDSLNNDDSIPLKVINQSQIKFEKQIVELDSLTGNYFIIEEAFQIIIYL